MNDDGQCGGVPFVVLQNIASLCLTLRPLPHICDLWFVVVGYPTIPRLSLYVYDKDTPPAATLILTLFFFSTTNYWSSVERCLTRALLFYLFFISLISRMGFFFF